MPHCRMNGASPLTVDARARDPAGDVVPAERRPRTPQVPGQRVIGQLRADEVERHERIPASRRRSRGAAGDGASRAATSRMTSTYSDHFTGPGGRSRSGVTTASDHGDPPAHALGLDPHELGARGWRRSRLLADEFPRRIVLGDAATTCAGNASDNREFRSFFDLGTLRLR